MKSVQIIRIALLLATIFGAGVVTGRITAPKPPALIVTADGRVATSAQAFARLNAQLDLNPAQQRQFRALFEDMAREMSQLPPMSRERLEVFRRHIPRMEALLRPEQRAAFERYVRDTEQRSERVIQRRSKQEERSL
jgi:hypothetical protein